MVAIDDVVYVIDENLLRFGKGVVAVRSDTARFSEAPVDDILPTGIDDPDWIPIVGERGWVMITNDRRIRTRPTEAQLAIDHKLKVVHLHGQAGTAAAWDQVIRLASRWEAVERQVRREPEGPWWLSVQASAARVMRFEPGKPERG